MLKIGSDCGIEMDRHLSLILNACQILGSSPIITTGLVESFQFQSKTLVCLKPIIIHLVSMLVTEGKDIYICRKTNCRCDREINLLLISEGDKWHHTVIKSLSRLLSSSNSKHKRKQYFCNNCLQGFTQELSRDQHYSYCIDNEMVRVEMPRKGSTVEFYDGQNQFKVPFMTYADFKAILEPIQERGPKGPASGVPSIAPHPAVVIPMSLTPQKLTSTFPLLGVFTASLLMVKLRIH